jgi:kelch-like protein 18
MVTTLNVRRGRVGVVTSNNMVYAIGGYDGMANLTTIEIFDPEEGKLYYLKMTLV